MNWMVLRRPVELAGSTGQLGAGLLFFEEPTDHLQRRMFAFPRDWEN